MPYPGTYVFEVVNCVEGWNDGTKRKSYKVSLRIVEIVNGGIDQPGTNAKHEIGDDVKAIMLETGPGMSEFKSFCMASAGFEVGDIAEYDAWDVEPEGAQAGDHIEACLGEKRRQDGSENPFAKDDSNPCVGAFVGATVSYTKPDGKGSFFRRYAWFVVETEDGATA